MKNGKMDRIDEYWGSYEKECLAGLSDTARRLARVSFISGLVAANQIYGRAMLVGDAVAVVNYDEDLAKIISEELGRVAK